MVYRDRVGFFDSLSEDEGGDDVDEEDDDEVFDDTHHPKKIAVGEALSPPPIPRLNGPNRVVLHTSPAAVEAAATAAVTSALMISSPAALTSFNHDAECALKKSSSRISCSDISLSHEMGLSVVETS